MAAERYPKRSIIFQEGDPGTDLYVVESGVVRISTDSLEGEEAILGEVHACESFGELGLIDGAARSASATAATDVVLLRLPGPAFRELFETDSKFRDCVAIALAEEVRRMTRNVGELHFLDLHGRLASRLARLARESQPGDDRDAAIDTRYSQSDLASMVGATRQSVNRALADLSEEGLVRIEGRRITVTDVPALEARAGY
jgi:CRP-like cAMP-binding protein